MVQDSPKRARSARIEGQRIALAALPVCISKNEKESKTDLAFLVNQTRDIETPLYPFPYPVINTL